VICKENGCENKVEARGWCNKHYKCWRRNGDPNIVKGHGYSAHLLYTVWGHMKQRCYNPNNKHYKDYGGRGIRVCDEWKNSAKTFIDWCLENGWKPGLQIDRRDNDGNYCSENCHFVTPEENSLNQRLLREDNTSGYRGVSKKNKKWESYITINGKKKHLGCFDSPRLAALRYDVEAYLTDNRPRNFF
jgi:hypothetical protein